jgi:diguanylate cyclase (GGDEF)-like protein
MRVAPPPKGSAHALAARALLLLNLLALAIGVAWFTFASSQVSSPLTAAGALVALAAATVLNRVVPAVQRAPSQQHFIDVSALLLFVTAIAYATGAAHSPLLTLYVMPLAAIALAFWRWWAVLIGVAAEILMLMLLGTRTPELSLNSPDFWALVGVALAPGTAVGLSLAGLANQMRDAQRQISDLAATDALTGLLNLRAFEDILQQAHRHAERTGRHYSIAVIHAEDVATINETSGHEAGSQVILAVAQALARSIRGADVAARLGGDEFVALLVEADVAIAAQIAQRIRNNVYNSTVAVGNRMIRVNVSVGTATFPGDHLYSKELTMIANQRMRRERELRSAPT